MYGMDDFVTLCDDVPSPVVDVTVVRNDVHEELVMLLIAYVDSQRGRIRAETPVEQGQTFAGDVHEGREYARAVLRSAFRL